MAPGILPHTPPFSRLEAPQQGVLWKRRDVFQHRWRPRWFVLQPREQVLTYYLLTSLAVEENNNSNNNNDHTNNNHVQDESSQPRSEGALRTRTFSQASEQSVDFDVVPRGSIELKDCRVTIPENDHHSSSADLYVFCIRPNNSRDKYYLGTRTSESRRQWVDWIQQVSGTSSSANGTTSQPNTPRTTNRTTPATDRRTVESPVVSSPSTNPPSLRSTTPRRLSAAWHALDDGCFRDVPTDLAARIRHSLQKYLPLADQAKTHHQHNWTVVQPTKSLSGGHSYAAYKRQEGPAALLCCEATFKNVTPSQLLPTMMVTSHRQALEPTIRKATRMHVYNPHTFLDAYHYKAVWPAAAREFTVVLHWQTLEHDSYRHGSSNDSSNPQRALVSLSFSCPQAAAAHGPVANHHVRGDLIINLTLFRTVPGGCQMTRFSSFDLGGGLSPSLSNMVLQNQASMPELMIRYVEESADQLLGLPPYVPLSNAAVIERIMGPALGLPTVAPTNLFAADESSIPSEESALSKSSPSSASSVSLSLPPSKQAPNAVAAATVPSLMVQMLVLFLPLFGYSLCHLLHAQLCALPAFIILAWLSVRQVVRWQMVGALGPLLDAPSFRDATLTCQIEVPTKGIQRYLANAREDKEDRGLLEENEEITVVHLVVSALARSLRAEPQLRRVCLPWLCLYGAVDVSDCPVTVGVSANNASVVSLRDVQTKTIQQISNELTRAEDNRDQGYTTTKNTKWYSSFSSYYPQCLVVASSDRMVQVDAAATRTAAVVALVQSHDNPTTLSVSMTLQANGRGYAEEVQKLLQFPELCDD